jgi:hypothetical protein
MPEGKFVFFSDFFFTNQSIAHRNKPLAHEETTDRLIATTPGKASLIQLAVEQIGRRSTNFQQYGGDQ